MILLRADSSGAAAADGRRPHFPIRAGSVHCAVTSPPYLGLRVYGADGHREVGRGDLEGYLRQIAWMALEVHRSLDDRGVLWLNLGDTAVGSGGAGGDHNTGGSKAHIPKYRPPRFDLDRMQFALVPSRVALMLQDLCTCSHARADHRRGGACAPFDAMCFCGGFTTAFLLRKWITWDKGRVRRGDDNFGHTRRPGASSEPVFMLTKGRDHRWNPDVIRSWPAAERGDVWHFPAGQPLGDRHFAPFPDALPARCITLTSDPGDIILDPYMGSGTTGRVAESLDRHAVGLDLYAGLPHVWEPAPTPVPA